MKIYFASDHAGFEMKGELLEFVKSLGYEVEDCGAYELDPDDDYPEFIKKAARKVSEDPENSRAIILGGSGQGEAIVANRFPNVRAIVFYPLYDFDSLFWKWSRIYEPLKLSRQHNDANVLSLGARFISKRRFMNTYGITRKAVKVWLETKFSGEERHQRRIKQIDNL